MSDRLQLSTGAQIALGLAGMEAEQLRSADIDVEHLVIGILKLVDIAAPGEIDRAPLPDAARTQVARERAPLAAALTSVKVDPTETRRRLRGICHAAQPKAAAFSGHRTPRCRNVFENAAAEGAVDLLALTAAALEVSSPLLDQLFQTIGVSRDAVRAALRGPAAPNEKAQPERQRPQGAAQYGRDLTALAADGKLQPAFGRNDEIKRIARILLQAKKANPLLIGDPGVGKTAVVEGLALKLIDASTPAALKALRIVEISMGALAAGVRYQGDFEERLQAVVKEAESDPHLVLFIDEIHMVLGAGGSGLNAGNLLKPALARGDMRVIGATTTAEYRKYLEKDAAFARRFQTVWIEEPGRDAAVQMLEALRPSLEAHHGLHIEPAAIERAVDLAIRYLHDLRLPDNAIDVIDQACARVLLSSFSPQPAGRPPAPRAVDADVIAAVIAERCRVPIDQVTVDEAARLLHMETFLQQRVMGQAHAIRAVADAIRTARAGLRDPRRPTGVFLLAGPTGTGKTELAKALAVFLFGDERRLIRIDMSEYGEKHSVARLIGSPPGYVGHDEGGQLTEAIRSHPYSVVLLDEIDKAHRDVLDVLLPVLDEGHLTDGHGRRASFADAVVIMTSNYGTAAVDAGGRAIGFASPVLQEAQTVLMPGVREHDGPSQADDTRIREAIARALRPELLNRIPHVVVFAPIGEAAGRAILEKILATVQARVGARGVTLELTPSAYTVLLRHGLSAEYGAREMERAVERLLVQPLGQALLERRFTSGTTVTIRGVGDRLAFDSSDAPTV